MNLKWRSAARVELFCLLVAAITYILLYSGGSRVVLEARNAVREMRANKGPGAKTPLRGVDEEEEGKTLDLAKFRFATHWGKETNKVLVAFSTWAEKYARAGVEERRQMFPAGISLAKKRREIVQTLIQNHPKLALAEAVPVLIRNELPESILGYLEERVTGRGDLLVLGRTDGKAISRRAVIGGRQFDAFVFGDRTGQRTTRGISLHGIAVGGDLALSGSPLRAFEEGEPVPAGKALADGTCLVSRQPSAPTAAGPRPNAVAAESADKVYWMCRGGHLVAAADGVNDLELSAAAMPFANAGSRSVLVMLVDFPDLQGGATTPELARETLESVSTFLGKNAYGQFSLDVKTVTRVLRLPGLSTAYSDPSQDAVLLDDARGVARGAGYAPESYDFDIVAFANIGQPWSGQGYVGDKGAWVQGSFAAGTVAHELGHNLGVWHANAWISSSIIGSHGIHDEYGNVFDIMGLRRNVPELHYNANFKFVLGWLAPANIHTVTETGTYRIYAQDQNSLVAGRKYGARIPVGIVAGGEVEDYWIDFRQLATGRYPATASGAIIQWGNDRGSQSASRLLDMNPQTSLMEDAPLGVDKTLQDLDRSLEITTVRKEGEGADAYIDVQITMSTVTPLDLGQALDGAGLVWTTSANEWIGQRTDTHDGVDAGASGATPDNGASYVETQVEGPGGLTFWWKVSSEDTFDKLRLLDNGAQLAVIAGEVNWQKKTFELGPGTHTLRWVYSKDGTAFGGADRAWLDEVTFSTENRPPSIDVPPSPVAVAAGEDVTFQVSAGGSAPLSYQWLKGGAPIPGATTTSLTVTNVQIADEGMYAVRVTNPFGEIRSGDALLTVIREVTLVEALDVAEIRWSTSTMAGWRGQSGVAHDGVDAAQSGAVANGAETMLEGRVEGPGTLSFWWKVSSEDKFDFVFFLLDGNVVEQRSGEGGWVFKTVIVPNGSHRIRWSYAKDNSVNDGMDAAWVDQVRFDASASIAPVILTQPAAQETGVGGAAVFTVDFYGTSPTEFQWFRNGEPLVEGPGRSGVTSQALTISNAQASDAGLYSVRVKNSYGEDLSEEALLTLVNLSLGDAVEAGGRIWKIGGGSFWRGQTEMTHDGVDAAASSPVGDNQETWFETVVNGPGTAAFWWRVESELDFDFLNFAIDGVVATSISGEVPWESVSMDFGAGEHTLRWVYKKDRNTAKLADMGWVDSIEITETIPQPRIENLLIEAGSVSGRIAALGAYTGEVILEASNDLSQWTPVWTNQITGATLNFQRTVSEPCQFLRARIR